MSVAESKQKEVRSMAYSTPELLLIGASSTVILGDASEVPDVCITDTEGSQFPELW
jgi:hypothetical protein